MALLFPGVAFHPGLLDPLQLHMVSLVFGTTLEKINSETV